MFLEEILMEKKKEIARQKAEWPLSKIFAELDRKQPLIRNFRDCISRKPIRLIAEIKKASPSRGLLCQNFNPAGLAIAYEAAGADAISVLTERRFFQGTLNDMLLVKQQTAAMPVLRKDFIIDRYQLAEAKLNGADAVLLIAAVLEPLLLKTLLQEAGKLGLASLVETHNREEIRTALEAGAEIIGINNRDLHSFKVDPQTTFRLLSEIPAGVIVVAESGIKERADLCRLEHAGVHAALIGEAIVTDPDPGGKIKALLGVA